MGTASPMVEIIERLIKLCEILTSIEIQLLKSELVCGSIPWPVLCYDHDYD